MRRTRIALVVLGVALLAGTGAYIGGGLQAFAAYRRTYARYATACDTLVAWAPPDRLYAGFYPNQPVFVSVRVRSPRPQTLRVTVDIPGFTEEQTTQVRAGTAFQSVDFHPSLVPAAADALLGPRQREAQARLRVRGDDGTTCETRAAITLKSRQWMRWSDPEMGDRSMYLAGWVTPQSNDVADFIGRAAQRLVEYEDDYRAATTLHGYNAGNASADDVRAQVNVLFDTLQFDYHVHYAQDNVPYGRDAEQLVQLPRDVLRSGAPTGMCVETTVLLASALERLGMRPYVVIIPGHAFLGVATSATSTGPDDYWETSALGSAVYGSQANVVGRGEAAEAARTGTLQRIIDIAAARDRGIQPME